MGDELDLLLGESQVMADLRATARRLAQRARTANHPPAVLILGETGTGKGLLANILHRIGPRAAGPLVDLNCASIPESLLESELFGHERGAFTGAAMARRGVFQAAHGGTLFLDEVGLLSPSLQAKLLKAVADRVVRRLGSTRAEPVDVWIISATNEDLAEAVRQRRFREDLYHRLAVVTLKLPPLRERCGDPLRLARTFLARAATDYRLRRLTLTAAAETRIATYRWPGNVRELANTIDRAALLSETSTIDEAALELGTESPMRNDTTSPPPESGRRSPSSSGSLSSLEGALRVHLQETLDRHGGNISRAADSLGIARNTLRAHIQRLQLRTGREVTARRPATAARPPLDEPESSGPLAATAIRGTPAEPLGQVPAVGSEGEAGPSDADPSPDHHVGRSDRPTALRWERQLLTFLALDLTPPPNVGALQLAPLLQKLVGLLERFGGRVGELAPLRVMATFGIDAVEDAPRRAAASALAAMKALERDAQAVTVRAALEVVDRLLTRAGPITGMDRAERRETQLTIDDLLASAAPSEILVSASALPHLDRSFELVTASGTTELGRVSHRLLPRERSGLLIGGRGQSSFVGRASELALLHTVLDRAERGHGQIVGILGEPGIGKSRLLHEFRATLDSDRATYLLARCVSYGSTIPYLPVVDVVRSVFGLSDGDDFDTVEAKLGRGVRATGLEPSTCVPYLLHLLGWRAAFESLADVSPEAVRMRSLDTLWALLGAASRARLTVCAIEDLQWIDPSSEEVLFRLIERLEGSSLLVLATYRPGYQPRWLGRSYAHQLALGRLTAADSLTVLKAHLPETNLAGGLTARLLDQADGIPFHLEELARALGQNPHPDAVIAVPPTLQGILAARLSRLPTTQCKLLQASAVIGREFSSATLAETVGQPLTQIRSELAALQAADFVVEILDRFRHVYRFRHALTQEVAYRTLLDHERRDLHARVAAAIESAEPDIVERRPEILARHYAEAGFPQQAASYSIHAGRLALGRSALVEAVVHLRHGLQLVALLQSTPERTHAELTLQLDLGTALAAQGGYAAPEVAEPLERARALADQLGDVPELFPVRWALWRFAFSRADYGTARTLAHQLRNTAVGPEGDDRRRVAELAVGAVHFYMGEFDSAAHAFQAAWHMHTPAGARAQILLYGQDLGAAARAFQAWAQALGAELDRSEQTGAEALHAARATGHPFSIGFTLYIVAWAAQLRGDTAYLQTLGSELAALAEQYSFKLLTAFGLMVRGWAARGTGDIEQAVDMITRGAELFRAVGQRAGLFHRALMAEAVLAAGSEDRSEEILHDALAQADATGEQGSLAELHRLLGDVKTRRNDAAGAEACYQRALEVATRQGAWLLALRAATGSVRLTRTTGVPSTEATRRLGEVIGQLPAGAEGHELRAARTLLDE